MVAMQSNEPLQSSEITQYCPFLADVHNTTPMDSKVKRTLLLYLTVGYTFNTVTVYNGGLFGNEDQFFDLDSNWHEMSEKMEYMNHAFYHDVRL